MANAPKRTQASGRGKITSTPNEDTTAGAPERIWIRPTDGYTDTRASSDDVEYVRADLYAFDPEDWIVVLAALKQERIDLINENSILAKASEVFRVERDDLRAAIRKALTELRDSGDDMVEASEATARMLYSALTEREAKE